MTQLKLPSRCCCRVSPKNISLLRKPLSNGTPAIAEDATMASTAVCGRYFHMPLMRRMSRLPVSWSMMPAAMNSEALKVAWLMMWNTAATLDSGVFSPSSSTIRPRWLMVENASRPLRSCWNNAMPAPTSRVVRPVRLTR